MDAHLESFYYTLQSDLNYSENTLAAYRRDLVRFKAYLQQKIGQAPKPEDLTHELISEYLQAERKAGYKPSTLYRRRAAVRRFVQYLSRQGMIELTLEEKKPFLKPRERHQVTKPKKVDVLSTQMVSKLLGAAAQEDNPRAIRDHAMLSLLFETGISIGTMIAIDMMDFRPWEKKVRIPGMKERDHWLAIEESAPLIERYLKEGRPELTQSEVEMALFVSQMGGRISRQGAWQTIKKWGRKAKIRKNLSPRLIRHTAAKKMADEGRPLEEIQQLLGHKNSYSTRSLMKRLG